MTKIDGGAFQALYMLTSTFTRLVTLGYASLAVFAFLESRELLSNSKGAELFQVDGGTLFVPLVLCIPENLEIDGTIISSRSRTRGTGRLLSSNETVASSVNGPPAECRQLDLLINACAFSLIFSAFASVVFVFVTCLARSNVGPFNNSGSAGMALFFSLILVQAGITTGALVEQNKFWVRYFQDLVVELDLDWNVESYSNSTILVSAALSAFGVAFLVLVDAIFNPCCRAGTSPSRDDDEDRQRSKVATAEEGRKRHSMQIEESAQSSTDSNDSPKGSTSFWANKV